MYNKNQDKMTQEQLRMQMLAGIITEDQYKAKLNEMDENEHNRIESYLDSKNIPWSEDMDGVNYDINGRTLVVGVGHGSYYAIDDETNTQFNSLEDIIEFYNIINESQSIMFKSKKYYIDNPEGKEKVFAYNDPELKQVAKLNGKTLMFKTTDIEDLLIK